VATGTEIVTDLFRWWEEFMKKRVDDYIGWT